MGLPRSDAAALWSAHASPVRAFVVKRMPATADLDPDDVVQEVFVRAFARLPAVRDPDRVGALLFQIARNVLADLLRRRYTRDALADRVAPEPEAVTAGPTGEPAGERDGAARLASCLGGMIERLPAAYRGALELTDLRGETQGEAAQRAGISLSGMKSRVQRGREQLKAIALASCAIELDVRGGVTACEPRSGGCDDPL